MGKYIKKADQLKYGTGTLDHGAYAVLHRSELLAKHPEIVLHVNAIRRRLLKDLSPEGPEHLPVARQVLLSRCLRKLETVILIEATLTEEKVQAAAPVTELWMNLNRQIRDDLRLLGLDRKALDVTPLTEAELLAKIMAEPAENEAKGPAGGPESDSGQDGKGEGQGGKE